MLTTLDWPEEVGVGDPQPQAHQRPGRRSMPEFTSQVAHSGSVLRSDPRASCIVVPSATRCAASRLAGRSSAADPLLRRARGRTPLIRRSCMTTTRSLMPRTSSMSELTIRMVMPCVGQRGHVAVDLGLGADVDAARRLVEDQHLRAHRQPLAQHDLLLVAAGQVHDLLVDAAAS